MRRQVELCCLLNCIFVCGFLTVFLLFLHCPCALAGGVACVRNKSCVGINPHRGGHQAGEMHKIMLSKELKDFPFKVHRCNTVALSLSLFIFLKKALTVCIKLSCILYKLTKT